MPVTSLSLYHLGVDNDACHNMCKNGTKSSTTELPASTKERARGDVRGHKEHIVFQMLRSKDKYGDPRPESIRRQSSGQTR